MAVTIDKPETLTYYIVNTIMYGYVDTDQCFTTDLVDEFDTETTVQQTYIDRCDVLGIDPILPPE